MIDIKLLRDNIDAVSKILARRKYHLDVQKFNALENERKQIQSKTQELQNQRNVQAKQIGEAKAEGKDITILLQQTQNLGDALKTSQEQLKIVLEKLDHFLSDIPNLPHEGVPDGNDETANVEIRRFGEPKVFDFEPKDHVALSEKQNRLDFNMASKLTGSRFVVMRGELVKLHRALIHFMIDVHVKEHGYQEIYVPYIVNRDSLFGTGQLPKFEEDLFKLEGDAGYYLIPTSEVPVTNIARDVTFQEKQLPIKFVCHTPCFRSEAGSYGKDTRGMIRQHQFEKVELVHFTTAENSYQAHEELTSHAEAILQKLQLPYRVMCLCTGDMGFSAAKTYDLEVWLPSQNKYREISSCSNTESFQARRMSARVKREAKEANEKNAKSEFIHTLNGSGLAVGRTLIAIMENYQDKNGNIHIPEVLKPYMGGMEVIG